MMEFIQANLANILICAALTAIVGTIITVMIRNRLSGKGSCGCADCPSASSCYSASRKR